MKPTRKLKAESRASSDSVRLGRRAFLQHSALASIGAGLAGAMPLKALALGCTPADLPRTLVNLMFQGGADLRYLFMPTPGALSASHEAMMWSARRPLYDGNYASYEQMFDNEYLLTTDAKSNQSFGIHRTAQWLNDQFTQGRVAVIANAHCSLNRRHDQSILNADAGDPDLDILNFDRSGWGGRLVEYLGQQGVTTANCVELGESVSTFNKGSTPGQRLERVVHAQDMRDMALAAESGDSAASRRNVLVRALRAYYAARGPEVVANQPGNWPYHTYFQHYDALNAVGEQVSQQLDQCLPLPENLATLQLSSGEFAQQCRNLFDACQVPDVLGVGSLSMNYGGWDTHNNQSFEINQNLGDVFGAEAGLASAMDAIETLEYSQHPAAEQLVFYCASDFGRQLVANGSSGTDHGRGTYSLLFGRAVRGGVYGQMFPVTEALPNADGIVPLQTPGADIEGLTSTDRILTVAADWVHPGAGTAVFPDAANAGQEPGVQLEALLPV